MTKEFKDDDEIDRLQQKYVDETVFDPGYVTGEICKKFKEVQKVLENCENLLDCKELKLVRKNPVILEGSGLDYKHGWDDDVFSLEELYDVVHQQNFQFRLDLRRAVLSLNILQNKIQDYVDRIESWDFMCDPYAIIKFLTDESENQENGKKIK